MLKKLLVFQLVLLSHFFIYSQIDVEWMAKYEYNPVSNDSPSGILIDNENNIYVSGITNDSNFPYEKDLVLIKYNNSGNELWRTSHSHGTEGDYGGIIKLINDYIYVSCIYSNTLYLMKFSIDGVFQEESIITYIESNPYEYRSLGAASVLYKDNYLYFLCSISSDWEINTTKLIKTDLMGNLIWDYTSALTLASRIKFDSEGNIVIVGRNHLGYYTNINGVEFDTKSDAFVRKISDNGTVIWDTTISSTEECFENLILLEIDEDDNIYSTYSKVNYYDDIPQTFKKFNYDGVLIWSYLFVHPQSGTSNYFRNIKYNNSKIYFNGRCEIPDTPNILTLCLDSEGSLDWYDNFYTDPLVSDNSDWHLLSIDNNDNIYSFGYKYGYNDSTRNDIVLKIYEPNGNALEEYFYNSTGNAEEFTSQVKMKLNSIYLTGVSDSDVMTIKFTNQYASSTTDLNLNSIQISPNPFNDKLRISLIGKYDNTNHKTITIHNLLGKKMYAKNITTNDITLTPLLSTGIYLLKISDYSQTLHTQKLIKIDN